MTAEKHHMAVILRILCLSALLLGGCHGLFGGRTTEEDQEKALFAEARQRAATYYDGRDYERAAQQYAKALEYRPDHFNTRLGYAYSLMYTKKPESLAQALEEFEDMGKRSDKKEEVKRIYGLAVTHRTLSARFQAQATYHDQKGMLDWVYRDLNNARKHARKGIEYFEQVLSIDEALAEVQKVAPRRVSASLTPDAHAGIAHCEIILADKDHPDHLKKAVEQIEVFAKVASQARTFWEKRRERVLMIDPVQDDRRGDALNATVRGQERTLYEMRIKGTIDQEVAMRRALVEVYIQTGMHMDVITETDKILQLDPEYNVAYWLRGQAYANLNPPNYRAAIKDLEEYRSRQDLRRLTDDLVRLNRWIKKYRDALKIQEKTGG